MNTIADNNRVAFKAYVNLDAAKIKKAVSNKKIQGDINSLIQDIFSFRNLPENSIVNVLPYSKKGQLRLQTVIKSPDGEMATEVSQNSVSGLLTNKKYRDEYLRAIQERIQVAPVSQKALESIERGILAIQNIVGLSGTSKVVEKTPDAVKKYFSTPAFKRSFFESFVSGNEPDVYLKSQLKQVKQLDDRQFLVSSTVDDSVAVVKFKEANNRSELSLNI